MFGEKHAMAFLAALSVTGCATASWFGGAPTGTETFVEPSAQHGQHNLNGQALTEYLDVMHILVEADPVTQAEVFRETTHAAEAWPTTTNLLRLALAVATPGHPWSNASEAQLRLMTLLRGDQTLRREERALARIHLQQVEQRLSMDEEARRLRNEAEETLAQQHTDNARLLERVLEENRLLREELADAQEKLEAITNIERSIRERESATDSP